MTVTRPTVSGETRHKTCPSPNFDARSLKNAKWCSTEEINYKGSGGSFKDLPKTWSPRNQPSPSSDKDFRPINFEGNSLKRVKRSVSSDSAYNSPDPKDSFAWKDSTLERKLKELNASKQLSDAPLPRNRDSDNSLGRTLENWKSVPLPKAEDPDVLLLKKARQEKKVKRYLEDNFQNRHDLVPKSSKPSRKSRQGSYSECETDNEIGALQAKYFTQDNNQNSSPPHSPPPFKKAESRYEREKKIKVGSLDSFTPGALREKSLSPPPNASSAQARYERERFRVQPGRIEDYRPGRCSVNSDKRSVTPGAGCSITKYSSSHSFNPLLSSRSEHNLAAGKDGTLSNGNSLQRSVKDGYESDSTLAYRKHHYNPQISPSPSQSKALYSQVQKGGEVPLSGLRMSDKDAGIPSIKVFQECQERPVSCSSNKNWENQRWGEMREQETEQEIKRRQQHQLNQFYNTISVQKESELRRDQENRKHHDTLLPNQKSPVPLNRYSEQDVNGNQAVFLNAGRKPEDCKMVVRALYSFQAQNPREITFKKGDIIYVKKQVDGNWYEGERNGFVGIFPTTYVEVLPSESAVTQDITRSLSRKEKLGEGEAKAKFNFAAQTPMELSLIKGETIIISRKIDSNWYEGRVSGRKGIFPVSYVQVVKEPGSGGGEESKSSQQSTASILKSGSAPNSFGTLQHTLDKPRSLGTMSPYSTLSRPTSALSNQPDKPQPTPYRAMYNYKPQNEDEVELCEGDVVFVMEKCDDGWYVGTSQRTGIFGTFPGNYVTQV